MKLKLFLLGLLALFISAQTNVGGELVDAAFENQSSDPGSGNIEGRVYWDTDDDLLRVYDGSAYKTIGDISGSGDVTGPGSATDNALTRYDGTTGKLVQDSGVTVDDTNILRGFSRMESAGYTNYWDSPDATLGYVGPTEVVLQDYFAIQSDENGTTGDYIEFYLNDNTGTNKLVELFGKHSTATRTQTYFRSSAGVGYLSGFQALSDTATPSSSFAEITSSTAFGATSKVRVSNAEILLQQITGGRISLAHQDGGAVRLVVPSGGFSSYSLNLPNAQGAASTALVNNGSGSLSWTHINKLELETADVCDAGTPANTEGLMFYNTTASASPGFPCYCDDAGADKKVSDNTSCF